MSAEMPRRLPEGCVEDKDRHGNVRAYYREAGKPKVRIRATPWTDEFMELYRLAKAGLPVTKTGTAKPGSWRWLCIKYFAECTEYKRYDPATQKRRRQLLEATYDEPIAPGDKRIFGDFPLSQMDEDSIEVLRDRKLNVPNQADERLKAIKQVFKFGKKKKHCKHNPARDVRYFRAATTGWHTWTIDEVMQYQDRHAIGTKARLALDLIMFTGVRKSDAIRLGRPHAKHGKLKFTEHKNRNLKPKRREIPILPILQATIDASPCGDLTYLGTEFGRPFTDKGFGNKMREWCDEAGLPQCSAHGIRKAGATIAATKGASAHTLMSIFGWDTLKQAELYTRDADRVRLAEQGMHLIIPTADISK